MSWIRSAMHKAADVPGGAKFRAAVRTYTDTVVHQAGVSVSEAVKLFQDRIAPPAVKRFSDAASRLEEASVSCKGEERVQLLRRWLVALKEFERLNGSSVENDGKYSEDPRMLSNENVTPGKPTMILHNDPDIGSSPMNFFDVFLQSQALEGMTMSMILGAPNEEEISLFHEIFGLCLTGGREVHDVVVRNIQELAKAFSVYDVEMLVRREELLQFAETAITGLKVTVDVTRIDSEISQIQQTLSGMKCQKSSSSPDTKESVAHIQLCCRLKTLLLKKRLVKKGDTPETRAQKVDKLKVLLESLHNSAYKTEKRILEHREQKKEILNFRVARNSEVSQIEKDLEAEISVIEKQRDKLEAELREVNSTLVAAITRLQDVREERLQFDEDNDEFLQHLKEKENELSKTAVSYRAEADTCNAFINFLEATWAFQSLVVKQRDKQVNDQLQNHEAYFVNAVTSFLVSYKDQLEPAIANFRKLLQSLKGFQYIIDPDEEFLHDIKQRENLEQEYLDAEAKVIDIFDAVDRIKEHFYSAIDDDNNGKGVEVINELYSAIVKIKRDFKTIKRPILRIEIPTNEELSPTTRSPQGPMIHSPGRVIHDFKSIFSQNLLVKSPRNKPYIPLGGSSENSPVSSKENHFKSVENKQHKTKVWESEMPSYFDENVSNVTKEETKEQSMLSERQESITHENSTLELDKELVKSVLDKETCMNTKTSKDRQRETTEASSTGNDADSSKSTSVNEEKGEASAKDVAGWEFDELVNEPTPYDYHLKNRIVS